MKHLLEFDSYSQTNEAVDIKSGTPVYDDVIFNKNINAKPAMVLKPAEILPVVGKMLEDKENGMLEKVYVLAEISSQGKNAPKYVLDDAAEERERQLQRKRIMYGSRTERDDRPDDDEQTDAINIFVDSEFIVVGVDETHILAIPESKKKKAESSKQMMEYYTVRLEPKQIFEIFFVPKSSNYVFEPKKEIDYSTIQIDGVDSNDYPDFVDAYISYAEYTDGTPLSDDELDKLNDDMPGYAQERALDSLT